jgi:hypothetical protein
MIDETRARRAAEALVADVAVGASAVGCCTGRLRMVGLGRIRGEL